MINKLQEMTPMKVIRIYNQVTSLLQECLAEKSCWFLRTRWLLELSLNSGIQSPHLPTWHSVFAPADLAFSLRTCRPGIQSPHLPTWHSVSAPADLAFSHGTCQPGIQSPHQTTWHSVSTPADLRKLHTCNMIWFQRQKNRLDSISWFVFIFM